MSRLILVVNSAVVLLSLGCSRQPLPANNTVAKDQAELAARYERIEVGTPEAEIAAFMGKPGAEVAGYATHAIKSKPATGDVAGPEGSDKYWASEDWKVAVRVVFRADGTARLIQLLRLTPMGPASR